VSSVWLVWTRGLHHLDWPMEEAVDDDYRAKQDVERGNPNKKTKERNSRVGETEGKGCRSASLFGREMLNMSYR
jgi:hypothetical protein